MNVTTFASLRSLNLSSYYAQSEIAGAYAFDILLPNTHRHPAETPLFTIARDTLYIILCGVLFAGLDAPVHLRMEIRCCDM